MTFDLILLKSMLLLAVGPMMLVLMLLMLMLQMMKETSETVLQHQLLVQMPELVFPILIQVEYALQPS